MKEVSMKLILEIISIVLLFGSIYASHELNEYRVTEVETDFKEHCTWGAEQNVKNGETITSIRLEQVTIKTDIKYIKDAVDSIERKLP